MFNLYPQATSHGNMTIPGPMMPPPQPSTPMNMGFGMMPGHGLTQWPMTQVCIIGTFEIVVFDLNSRINVVNLVMFHHQF